LNQRGGHAEENVTEPAGTTPVAAVRVRVGTSVVVQQKMMCHPDIRPTFNIYGDVVTDAMTTASAKVAQLSFCAEIGRLGLARICNATAITTKKRSAKTPKVFSDPDGCDVYSAVLPMDEWYWQNSKTLLIVQELPPDEWPIGSPKARFKETSNFVELLRQSFVRSTRSPGARRCWSVISRSRNLTRWSARPHCMQPFDTFRQTQ
jgi:hypothetical protein